MIKYEKGQNSRVQEYSAKYHTDGYELGYFGNKQVQTQVNLISEMLRVNFNASPLYQINKCAL